MQGFKRLYKIPHISTPYRGRKTQEHSVGIEFKADCRPIPRRYKDGKNPPQSFIRFMTGTDITDYSLLGIFKGYDMITGYKGAVLVHFGQESLGIPDTLLVVGVPRDCTCPPNLTDLMCD